MVNLFGAYGSIYQPMTITVNGDMNNLDFPTELSVTLPAHNSLSGNISREDASNPNPMIGEFLI